MAKKTKKVPKWLADEMRLLGWKAAGNGLMDGYVWVKDGEMLTIVPSEMGRMYHVTKEKMSERETMFLHEPKLIALIEGDSYE